MAKQNLADFLEDAPKEELQSGKAVPNCFPRIAFTSYRIAIVGEAPGRDEESFGTPFVGMSGRLLNQVLSKVGILRDACFIGNVCQQRPPNNDITIFSREGETIKTGLEQLKKDLNSFQPNIVLLLGKTALWAFSGRDDIGNYRGSLFMGNLLGDSYKCISSYHPAACLRQYDWTFHLAKDMQKALSEATSKDLLLPQRELIVDVEADRVLYNLQSPISVASVDIEGYVGNMSCISVSKSPTHSFIVPFTNMDGSSVYDLETEMLLWRDLSTNLNDIHIRKTLQNSLYDRFVLHYSYGIVVHGVTEDTMLKQWELYCELEKSLGFQCSIYTKEPFYKQERKSNDRSAFFRYCCRDSAVTYEIADSQESKLKSNPSALQHYRFNVALLNPLLYMELRGIKYESKKAKARLREIEHHIYALQKELDDLAGVGIDGTLSRELLMEKVRDIMCFKRDRTQAKKEFEEDYDKCIRILLGEGPLTNEDLGYLNVACGLSMNVKSPAYKDFLYKVLGLPMQYDRTTKALTTNNEALLAIQKKSPHEAVRLGMDIMELRTRAQTLSIQTDKDGRIRCSYNIVGTVTGRISCSTSPTGSGYNLQTIPDDYKSLPEGHPLRTGMRDLFIADEGYHMFQCDLKGSDGWTIGAHMKALGDSSMFDDLMFGIKPASRTCYLLRHGNQSLHNKPREEVKELLTEVKKDDWDYFACKIGIWGICYLMGPDLLSSQISEESYGKINMSRSEVSAFRDAVFAAYHVRIWHEWLGRKLRIKPEITSASGHTRHFYGRPQEILGQALADEPQENTTYATNLAAFRLWTDPENRILAVPKLSLSGQLYSVSTSLEMSKVQRRNANSLRIEPLHQVHDALIGQFKISDTAWAVDKIKSYFANPITIAGITLTIPFEGNYGPSWGHLDKGTI